MTRHLILFLTDTRSTGCRSWPQFPSQSRLTWTSVLPWIFTGWVAWGRLGWVGFAMVRFCLALFVTFCMSCFYMITDDVAQVWHVHMLAPVRWGYHFMLSSNHLTHLIISSSHHLIISLSHLISSSLLLFLTPVTSWTVSMWLADCWATSSLPMGWESAVCILSIDLSPNPLSFWKPLVFGLPTEALAS